jgi:hypothetical protein
MLNYAVEIMFQGDIQANQPSRFSFAYYTTNIKSRIIQSSKGCFQIHQCAAGLALSAVIFVNT